MLPKSKKVDGVLILLEDSGYDKMNNNSKQLYSHGLEQHFAIMSVSSEIPFDFYFSASSLEATHAIIAQVFEEYQLPNQNVFFLGGSLVGHRALKYIEFIQGEETEFKPNIRGLVLVNFTMDWTRKWEQHQRDIRLDRIDLWEPRFINFMLETHLGGTPLEVPEAYHGFSTYSYSNKDNNHLELYRDLSIRVYIEPDIAHRLKKYTRTLYENNATDMVGFLAELEILGNQNTQLVVMQPETEETERKNALKSWDRIDKDELMQWILKQ